MPTNLSQRDWEAVLERHPEAHLLQTAAWGELKAAFGWQVARVESGQAAAQVLLRPLPFGLRLAYIPRGPIGDWLPGLLPEVDRACRAAGAFALTLEPDAPDDPALARLLAAHGFRVSQRPIQPRRTLLVHLDGTEDDVLARMHQKTRYNIRLAAKKEVVVEAWSDLEAFGRMMQDTAARDGFGAHAPAYYACAYKLFHPGGACELFVARHVGMNLAALMVFARGSRAWYLYGASLDVDRQRMPAYLLQWEAMRWAKSRGCTTYDLWGVPDAELEALERDFANRADGLWGVYRFKRGFGGELVRSIGAWDRVYQPRRYAIFQQLARWRRLAA
jgi:lipid II:glycine glycyltransferase (peptidoglycan interpeptide bridge formation enzyme)